MNKPAFPSLALPGRLRIASDVHLAADVPHTARAFYAFLAHSAQQADALILAGDLFDAWVGDDCIARAPAPWLSEALQALRRCAAAIPVHLLHGNRDFLMGERLARALGAHLLPAQVVLHTDAGALLLAHGDEFCTADRGYQRFRRVVRTPWVQRAFLRLPLTWRLRIAAQARARSRQAQRHKTLRIMDVSTQPVLEALRAAQCQVLVHGHTHRPAVHRLEALGADARRVVLPDWDLDHAQPMRGGWVDVDAQGVRLQAALPDEMRAG